jgi:hypothetical protein
MRHPLGEHAIPRRFRRSVERMKGSVMTSLIVEIRAAEGGDDAKLLVVEQARIYLRLAGRRLL